MFYINSDDDGIIRTRYITRYGGNRVRNSDIDSDTDLSDSDLDIAGDAANIRRHSSSSDVSSKGWFSWCSIL